MTERRDDGYFPRGRSMLRRVHEQRAVGLMFGQRALMIGALKPLNYIGTREHSKALQTPFARLAHTGQAFETIFFGSRAEADRVLEAVARLHDRVEGTLPEDSGVTRAGTPYSAYDPELMLWTVAVIADSAEVFYELLVRPLSRREKEALWRDYVRFGELFVMPPEAAPGSHREFRAWWEGTLASEEMHLNDDARYVGYATAFEIPIPGIYAPAARLHNLVMLGSLPPRVRLLYGLSWSRRQKLAFRAAASALRRSRLLVPERIRRGENSASFELVARTERQRIERGEPTPALARLL
jgi:uncharacterized protein (DUF2236 family)